MPACYYPQNTENFITRYIEEKVPDYFIHKQLFLDIVKNPDQDYHLTELMPLYADLLTYEKINAGLIQLGLNNILRKTIEALSDLF